MPLKANLPVIDDRNFENLVSEARARIPRYTPEWTDLNDTDPGIVLMQLFAWLTELQIFRMSKVPELNYLKFLELIGIELESAKAAIASVNFPLQATFGETTTIIPAKTQIATEQPDEQGQIIFEINKAATVIRSELVSLQSRDRLNFRDLTDGNLDAVVEFRPFGDTASEGDTFLLGFSEELPQANFSLTVWVPIAQKETVVTRCFTDVQAINTTRLIWEYWNGGEWQELIILQDTTAAFIRQGEVTLQGPAPGRMVAEVFGEVAQPRFWIRARIDSAGYEQPPQMLAIRTNTLPVTQAETFQFESVGGSNGEIDQEMLLRFTPIIVGSLVLEVDEGEGYVPWEEIADLFGSGPDDTHYVLNRATGAIRFGDGSNGRVPVANANNNVNVRALVYRVGGGKRGNVAAGQINKVLNSLPGVAANDVTNLFESGGGADEESLDEAKRRAPSAIKSRDRAVTAEDFEELSMRAANIARAKALPLSHPEFPGIEVPGVISVVVVPDLPKDPAPMPSQGTLQTVCAYLNQRRLLTSELYIKGPTYLEVTVDVELVVDGSADLAEVKAKALDSLRLYFHPLLGGESSNPDLPEGDPERSGSGWPFGQDIYYSLLSRRLLIAGVTRVVSLEIQVNNEVYRNCEDAPVAEGVLLTNGDHMVAVEYEVNA